LISIQECKKEKVAIEVYTVSNVKMQTRYLNRWIMKKKPLVNFVREVQIIKQKHDF